MSKYIIEIPDDVQYVLLNGKADGKFYTAVHPVAELEILNSDYINEHYGELQDEAYQRGINDGSLDVKQRVEGAYQRGLEDGKWKAEDGCDGCKYYEDTSLTNPCSECSRGHVDRYEPLSDPDRIEVGNEVSTRDGAPSHTFLVTKVTDSHVYGISNDGSWNYYTKDSVTKTGKHYDIASILEAMRTHD